MSLIDERLKALGIVLPDMAPPVGNGYVAAFAPYLWSGNPLSVRPSREKER